MAKEFYALGDCGGSNLRLGIYTPEGEVRAYVETETDPHDYTGSIALIADRWQEMAESSGGEIVAASLAVAAEVSAMGELTKAGTLSPWIGHNPGYDLEGALNLLPGTVGTPNDVEAIAISQHHVNRANKRPMDGLAATLSTGFNDARYYATGKTKPDEAGHVFLRPGQICPCGEDGHVEAFIAGGGVERNWNMDMKTYLETQAGAIETLVGDIADTIIGLLGRHAESGFRPNEMRWTGGVALGQPFVMQSAYKEVRRRLGANFTPVMDTATMGRSAGLHGTLIDANRRAVAA